jgi:hypothetical protein
MDDPTKKSAAMEDLRKKIPLETLEAARKGSVGQPLSKEMQQPGIGIRSTINKAAQQAYAQAAQRSGIPLVKTVKLPAAGRRRKGRTGKKLKTRKHGKRHSRK